MRMIPKIAALLLVAVSSLPAPAPSINDFFDQFAAEWLRADPQRATLVQYFTGAEQDRLDRLLTIQNTAWQQSRVRRARTGLAELRKFDFKRLTASQRTSARVLEWELNTVIRSAPFAGTGYVFDQFSGLPGFWLVEFMSAIHPVRNRRDAENYVARLSQGAVLLDEAVAESRRRAAKNVLPPRFIVAATIAQIERLTKPDPGQSILVTSLDERLAKLSALTGQERKELHEAARKAVAESINPALDRAANMLRTQLTVATEEAGFWRLPGGLAAYADQLRQYTTTDYTPEQIHQIGLEQVARIEKQMDAALRELGYREGSVSDRYRKATDDRSYQQTPDVRDRVLADYEQILRDAEVRAITLFDLRPKAGVVVRRVPEFREKDTGTAYYFPPARDGSRPGTFFVPLAGPKFGRLDMRSRSYHEAVPGHHFQIALQQEDDELPRFRREFVFDPQSAYAEGWGLYVEALAIENGWYQDDLPSRIGALERQLFRARRLVVDTGIHAKRWTRQQAIDYGLSPAEVDRYVVMPGQACAYMIGQLHILQLRDKARRELGDRFSIKEFHNVVLRTGSVPLGILSQAVDEYIIAKRPPA